MKFKKKFTITCEGPYCDDFCDAMLSVQDKTGEFVIYCGYFGGHELERRGEDIIRHDQCHQAYSFDEDMRLNKKLNVHLIQDRMCQYGITQRRLTIRLESQPRTVAKWFKQKTFPQTWNLEKLAKILNISLEEMII